MRDLNLFVLGTLFLFLLSSSAYCNLIPAEQLFFTELLQQNAAWNPTLREGGSIDQPCTWEQVKCSDNGLHVLLLENIVPTAFSLPISFGNLQQLRVLNLQNNRNLVLPANFTGYFPNLVELSLPFTLLALPDLTPLTCLRILVLDNFLGTLHNSICNLPSLERLSLHSAFINSLPECISNLSNLRFLDAERSTLTQFPNVFRLLNLEELRITNTRIGPTIPSEIGNLTNLRVLHAISLSLQIGATIPESIGNLVNLEELHLSNNELGGTIPASIGNLKNLRFLVLTNNNLEGTIPNEIVNCDSLEAISFDRNALTGTIPSDIGRLPYLTHLFIVSNILEGTIPASLGNCRNLSIIMLTSNQLTGTLPPELSHLIHMRHLSLANNLLSGTIPPSYKDWHKLDMLILSYNNFHGPLISFAEMKALRAITLQFNQFSGTISDEFTNQHTNLNYIHLQNNQLTGTIPLSLVSLPTILDIDLSRNRITGTIPTILVQSNFVLINLAHNMLSGTLPAIRTTRLSTINLSFNQLNGTVVDFTECWRCSVVDLSNNYFEGALPRLNGQMRQLDLSRNKFNATIRDDYFGNNHLQRLNIAHNSISGTISNPISSALLHADVSHNRLSGSIPDNFLRFLQTIILSHNEFSGGWPQTNTRNSILVRFLANNNRLSDHLPQGFLEFDNLVEFDISNNNFRGMIPTITSGARQLRELRMSNNRFLGAVPPSLALLTNLEVIDLSFNSLTGQIPSQWGSFQHLRELYLSNNRLIGNLPNSFVVLEALEVLDLANNNFDGTLLNPLFRLYGLHTLNLAGNRFAGEIPNELFQVLLSLTDVNLCNNSLTGALPPALFNLHRIRKIDLSYNSFGGTIPSAVTNMRTLEELKLSANQLTGTIPTLNGLNNLINFEAHSNSLVGCLRLPRHFTTNNSRCNIEGNQICCGAAEYRCAGNCNDRVLHVPFDRFFLHAEDDFPFDKLILESNASLVVRTGLRAAVYCANVTGSIKFANFYRESEDHPPTVFSYTCGTFNPSSVSMDDDRCRITNRAVSTQNDSTTYTYSWECPGPPAGTSAEVIVAAVVVSIGGTILFIVIGIISVRYVRGKRRVEQLLNRVELLTLTTKSGDDQFSLPQWHAPEDYSLKPIEDLPIQLTNTKFDFGTKGNLLQVDSMYKDAFKVQAKAKANHSRGLIERLLEKTMRVQFHPVQSTKFQLTVDPAEIDLRGNEETNVTLMLQMRMTTKTNISLWVEVPELKQFSLLEFVCASEPSPWIDIDDVYDVSESLGEGGFGAVYKAKYRGQQIAFKKLKYQEMDLPLLEEFNREVQMMMNLHHRCIVQFIGASKVPGKLAILTEFVSGGNLQELLNTKQLDIGLKLKIALDVAEALQFLHANNILHRDIKAENVLVASIAKEASVNVKLTDFGTARSIVEEVTMKFTKGIGTPTYMAPEILDNKQYERSADIYSFGILLWAIMTQQMPYIEVMNSWDIAAMVLEGKRPVIPGSLPIAIKELIEACWDQSPNSRPTIDRVVQQLNLILSTRM